MIWDYVSAVSGIFGTLVALLLSMYAFFMFRNAALRYRLREARLPDATLLDDLRQQIVKHHARLEEIRSEAANAQEIIGQSHVARAEYHQLLEKADHSRADLDGLRQLYAERKYNAEIEFQQMSIKLQTDFSKLEDKLRKEQRSLEQSVADVRQSVAQEVGETERELKNRKNNIETAIGSEIRELEQSLVSFKATVAHDIANLEREQEITSRRLNSEHESEIAILQRDFDLKKGRITSSFEQQKAEFISQLESFRSQSDVARKENERLEALNSELTEYVEQLRQDRGELRIEVDGLRSEKLQLESTLPQLREIWKRLLEQTGGGNDSNRTAELWQPVFHNAERQNNFPEEEGLTHVQTYLESCGLRYSQRTLFAFHTSLKVTDSSPLVVLAGISGTGKSELPRRYAEALGMNFLPIAVQPRWDSPQDMFGFFNYLEHRFRATELGRSLVQMDPYFDESNRGWPTELPESYVNLSDQLLLVLLDEMNLARVEYYFSEFLSRLEYRPGVIKTDSDSRRKAEVPLEIGRAGLGSPTMNIFVPTNVLFVGTMNEDETTQTLSDKVVDRANVIRFGCPKSLELSQVLAPVTPTTYRLSAANWAEWQVANEEAPGDREQVEQWIDRLKQAMSVVKRPFAHRTSRAIRSYVANYPRIDSKWFHHAVADQIEQKLMPKFRGLDPSESDVRESLDKIRDIARELEDGELEEAIQSSRDGHQFSWSGIDRAASLEESR